MKYIIYNFFIKNKKMNHKEKKKEKFQFKNEIQKIQMSK